MPAFRTLRVALTRVWILTVAHPDLLRSTEEFSVVITPVTGYCEGLSCKTLCDPPDCWRLGGNKTVRVDCPEFLRIPQVSCSFRGDCGHGRAIPATSADIRPLFAAARDL